MILATVLATLWRMLDTKRRAVFIVLLFALFGAGVFEMVGMIAIFGFISGLKHDDVAGVRHGPVAKLFHLVHPEPLTDVQFAIFGGIFMLVVVGAKNGVGLIVRHQLSRFLSNLNRRITEALFGGFLLAPYTDLTNEVHGSPESIVRANMEVVSGAFKDATQIVADCAILLMVALLLLHTDPLLTLGATLLFGVGGMWTFRILARHQRQLGRDELAARETVARYLSESFRALIETRLRENTRYYVNKFRGGLRDTLNTQRSRQALSRVPRAANEMLLATAVTGSVIYVVLSGGDLTTFLPTLAVFGFAGLRTNGAMSRISASLQGLKRRAEEFERQRNALIRIAPRVFQDQVELDSPPTYLADELDAEAARELPFKHELVLDDISFMYPESTELAVDHLSMRVTPGTFVSFCGESGGGKSTLLLLLMGIVQPTSGRILCDGKDVKQYVRAWHRQIGYVSQSLFISSTSVRENVAFGIQDDKIDDARVEHALRQAAAWDFVSKMPDGVRTILKRNGARLSGGQRQRIVIARALYHNPRILVLDEATSALDTATEKLITGALQDLRATKTVICVAHRLSSIRASDEIFVMRRGRLLDHGTYDELLARSEYFRQLANELKKKSAAD